MPRRRDETPRDAAKIEIESARIDRATETDHALGGGALTLDVTGPDGTASLLADLLDPSIAA